MAPSPLLLPGNLSLLYLLLPLFISCFPCLSLFLPLLLLCFNASLFFCSLYKSDTSDIYTHTHLWTCAWADLRAIDNTNNTNKLLIRKYTQLLPTTIHSLSLSRCLAGCRCVSTLCWGCCSSSLHLHHSGTLLPDYRRPHCTNYGFGGLLLRSLAPHTLRRATIPQSCYTAATIW